MEGRLLISTGVISPLMKRVARSYALEKHGHAPGRSPEEIEKSKEFTEEVWAHRRDRNKRVKLKVIVSGHIVEVYRYEKSVTIGDRPTPERSELEIDEETGEILNRPSNDPEEVRRNNGRRAKSELRRLIVSNFSAESDKFLTLTFRDGSVNDVTNLDDCNHAFKKFIQRMKRKYDDFKFVVVTEFQDANGRGAIHYHMIASLPYIKAGVLEGIWGNGFVRQTKITHVDNLGAYVTKYMTKDVADKRLIGKKAYRTSRNLLRPIVLHGAEASRLLYDHLGVGKKIERKAVYEKSYPSEHQGKVTYSEYNLNRSE